MGPTLRIDSGQFCDRGTKAHNDDACGVSIPDEPLLTTRGVCAVVADGVSRSAGGAEASAACVQGFLSDYYSTPESWATKTAGQRVLGALNRWLHGQGHRVFGHGHGMITTLSAVVFKSTTAHLFHVGDTRIYRLRAGELECLTTDHRAWHGGEKTYLARALGADVNVEIDYRALAAEVGDLYLLSTDGVHDFVTAGELRALLEAHGEHLDRAARAIAALALDKGGNDNVSCIVLRIAELPLQSRNEFCRHLAERPFPPPLDPGMVLDGYRIVRELAASKRTQIYLAVDTHSGERLAIKTPSVNYEDDPEYIERFLREEWTGRRIRSPHVLKVLEPRRHHSLLYYVTEYVEGQTLRQWLHDHPQPPLAEVRAIVGQIAAGLRAFHRLEMLHQDLKPENVLIDRDGIVKLIDFGSAKIAGIEEIATPLEAHQLLGTENYTAPEYLQGGRGSNRSDIYSLGVIAYELLTGDLPYGEGLTAQRLRRVHYTPARERRADLPAWVDGALAKAVHLDPARRYEALSEFTHDLSHPNAALLPAEFRPLLERDPLAFWRGLALALLGLCAVLVYLLASRP